MIELWEYALILAKFERDLKALAENIDQLDFIVNLEEKLFEKSRTSNIKYKLIIWRIYDLDEYFMRVVIFQFFYGLLIKIIST